MNFLLMKNHRLKKIKSCHHLVYCHFPNLLPNYPM